MNTTETIVIALIAALIVLGVIVAVYTQRRNSQRLRDRFGPEYHRMVEETGAEREAEARLAAREARVKKFNLKPLSAADRERFGAAWRRIQARFVDNPKDAADSADELLGQVMTARGYPDGDFDQRLEDLSVDHGQAVQDYRAAHEVLLRHAKGQADTEAMRQAMLHYRTLFDELVGEPERLRAAS